MKMTIEVDCTPTEARLFLGLPDLTPLNEHLVGEMRKRLESNAALADPEALLRQWMVMGGQAQGQFRDMMSSMVRGARDKAE